MYKKVCDRCWYKFDSKFSFTKYCSIKCRTKSSSERRQLKGRKNDIVRKYGICELTFTRILSEQESVCGICKKKETAMDARKNKVKDLAVDHDHKTGIIRGLLCQRCNMMIGHCGDNTDILRQAIKYLKNGNKGKDKKVN